MLYGMGTVVLFLALLVVATMAMSTVIGTYFPEPQRPEPVAKADHAGLGKAETLDATTLAVIATAIHEHRKRGL